MPLSVPSLLEGAKNRAESVLGILAQEGNRPDLGVGLEGGVEIRMEQAERRGFLMAWAYVTDGRRGSYGCGGAIELPRLLVAQVVDQGIELSMAIDAFARETDVRSRQGAWGVLTRGLMDRTRSFEVALINAFAPFYNPECYP